jgi:hypothetical protein
MGIIVKPNTFSNNTAAQASEVNSNFDTIFNDYNGNIGAANISSSAITTAKIADSAVTTVKIADSNVTTAKIADSSVTTAKIAAGAVTNAKLDTATGGLGAAFTTYTPTLTGFSATTVNSGRYLQIGKLVLLYVDINGTSSTTGFTFTLPVAAKGTDNFGGMRVANAGAFTTTPGYIGLTASSTTATVFLTHAAVAAGWTASGSKVLNGYIMYEAL